MPGIHVLTARSEKDVDGRDKPGHDEGMDLAAHASAGHFFDLEQNTPAHYGVP
jgi:hypothetical protein